MTSARRRWCRRSRAGAGGTAFQRETEAIRRTRPSSEEHGRSQTTGELGNARVETGDHDSVPGGTCYTDFDTPERYLEGKRSLQGQ